MKKSSILFSIIVAIMFVFLSTSSVGAQQPVKLTLNGEELKFDAQPLITDNRTLVPIRVLFEDLGLEVKWHNSTRSATISNEKQSIELTADSKDVTVNGTQKKMDVPAIINQGRLYVPLRFVLETNGLDVNWDQDSRTIHLQSSILVDNIDEVLEKLLSVELKSFSSDMKLEQTMTVNGEVMEMIAKATQDVVVEPFGFYQKMEMSMLGEVMVMESYMTEEGFYLYDPLEGQWIQLDNSTFADINELLNMDNLSNDPVSQLEFMQDYLTDITIYDRGPHYVLNYSIDSEGYHKLIQDLLGSTVEFEDELLQDLTFDKMVFSITYDKESFFPTSFSSHTELSMQIENEKMHLVQKMTGNYKNINSIKEIKIPRNVIENAIQM